MTPAQAPNVDLRGRLTREQQVAELYAEETSSLPQSTTAPALPANGTVGAASEVLCERFAITPEAACQTLISLGMHLHRTVRDVASNVVVNGDLPTQCALPG